MKRQRRPITPHRCPAEPDGAFRPISIASLRSAGLNSEADQLQASVDKAQLWSRAGVGYTENGIALGLFGCCKRAELAATVAGLAATA